DRHRQRRRIAAQMVAAIEHAIACRANRGREARRISSILAIDQVSQFSPGHIDDRSQVARTEPPHPWIGAKTSGGGVYCSQAPREVLNPFGYISGGLRSL